MTKIGNSFKKYYLLIISLLIFTSFLVFSLIKPIFFKINENEIVVTSPTPSTITTPTQTATPTPMPTATSSVTTEATATPTQANQAGENLNVYVTYYGWPDNDPAGKAIAYPHNEYSETLHNEAGGVGTYNDPITFAAKKGRFSIGTKIYVAYIKKYVILEDTCANCKQDHIDIWMNSDGNNSQAVLSCEDYYTRDSENVVINPDPNREVSTTPLFETQSGTCQK